MAGKLLIEHRQNSQLEALLVDGVTTQVPARSELTDLLCGADPGHAFDSLEAVARDLYWWTPVRLLIRNRMPTIQFVRGSLAPTALIIAERDDSTL